jgi:hypothetical protein
VRGAVHQVRSISQSVDLYIFGAGKIDSIKAPAMSDKDWQPNLEANLTGASALRTPARCPGYMILPGVRRFEASFTPEVFIERRSINKPNERRI